MSFSKRLTQSREQEGEGLALPCGSALCASPAFWPRGPWPRRGVSRACGSSRGVSRVCGSGGGSAVCAGAAGRPPSGRHLPPDITASATCRIRVPSGRCVPTRPQAGPPSTATVRDSPAGLRLRLCAGPVQSLPCRRPPVPAAAVLRAVSDRTLTGSANTCRAHSHFWRMDSSLSLETGEIPLYLSSSKRVFSVLNLPFSTKPRILLAGLCHRGTPV